jgi:hypothetical protein
MPESAWWLLLILTGDITVPDLLEHLTHDTQGDA